MLFPVELVLLVAHLGEEAMHRSACRLRRIPISLVDVLAVNEDVDRSVIGHQLTIVVVVKRYDDLVRSFHYSRSTRHVHVHTTHEHSATLRMAMLAASHQAPNPDQIGSSTVQAKLLDDWTC